MTPESTDTRVECIECGTKQTHRVCADCFARQSADESVPEMLARVAEAVETAEREADRHENAAGGDDV